MKLEVRYHGLKPDRGRMAASDLGPAILGLGEIVGQASRVLYGDTTRVRVDVHAEPKRASFGIEFFAVSTAAGLLPPLSLEQLGQICTILGIGVVPTGIGLIHAVRWLRGRKIDKAERRGDEINITVNDQSVNLTVNEYKVFVDPEVRKGLKAIVAPLEEEGFDSVSIIGGDRTEEIKKAEARFFTNVPLPEEEIGIDRSTAILEIVSLSFRDQYQWRFAQGNETFFAHILDEQFLAEVLRRRENFQSGDALRVELEIRTTRTPDGFKFDRKIMRVIEHIRREGGSGQLPLV